MERDTTAPPISFAYRKFKELDLDNSGSLKGPEMLQLAQWVFSAFRRDGVLLSDAQAYREAQRLCQELDTNHDGSISFEEFVKYFESRVAVRQGDKVKIVLPETGNRFNMTSCSANIGEENWGTRLVFKKVGDLDSTGIVKHDDMVGIFSAETGCRLDASSAGCDASAESAATVFSILHSDGEDLKYNSEVALFSADSQQRVDIQGAYADGTKDSWATKFRILKVEDAFVPELPPLSAAYTKFTELDVDQDGELGPAELEALAVWVYEAFQIEKGKSMDPGKAAKEAQKLQRYLDKDKSGGVSFDEFCSYYEKKLKQAQAFATAVGT